MGHHNLHASRLPRTPDATHVINEARRAPRNAGAVLLKVFWVRDKKMFAVTACVQRPCVENTTHVLIGLGYTSLIGYVLQACRKELLVRRGRLSDYVQRPCNLLHNIPPLLKSHAFRSASPGRVADSRLTIYASENSDRRHPKPPRHDSGPHAAKSCGKCVMNKLRRA